jgi:P4 family phage/plasmid primase-like protien
MEKVMELAVEEFPSDENFSEVEEKDVFYYKKSNALKKVHDGQIVCNRELSKYFILDSHQEFIDLITNDKNKNFYEYIPNTIPVPLFFDIEIYKDNSEYFANWEYLLQLLFERIKTQFLDKLSSEYAEYTCKKIVLESHNHEKKSFHIIYQLTNEDGQYLLFPNVKYLRELYKLLDLENYKDSNDKYLIDPSVYREGLFRTYASSKNGENRPLIKSNIGDDFEPIYSFITYYSKLDHQILPVDPVFVDLEECQRVNATKEIVNVPEELEEDDKSIIKHYIQRNYHYTPSKIRDLFIDRQFNCIIVALNERFCPHKDREHHSNNQYIVIDTISSKQKCHDSECNDKRWNEIKTEDYPKEINEVIKKCLKINREELELINKTIEECKNYITENYDANIQEVTFDRNEMIFRGNVEDRNLIRILKGKCPECNVEHQISDNGYCLKCKTCSSIFPKNHLIPIDNKYKALNNFWANYQVGNTINNVINNVIINNNSGEEDFSCDVQLDRKIIKDKRVLRVVNECLDGHKITKMAELMSILYKDYIFTGNDWYIFNGCKWALDNKSLNFKKNILDLCSVFNKIKQYYENQQGTDATLNLIKNIKSLITKINKPQLKDDILKDAQLFYIDNDFYKRLNSKNHLVPFGNGVFDLLANQFKKTRKEDYINLTTGFDYNHGSRNPEVYQFIENILPNRGVRDYVLKKMSECLNGDIPNTNFLMFIGDGANGKSQLLNLMKLTIGEFGEKVEVTLLTRKRNNANEANTEKIKLMNKRFAFLSEPEDGEKINIGLLKELTGSEEIVARGLYQDSVSFVMAAKLFLACNELPEIKGEDTALWRRIRVIDFPSRFVDDPKESNEFKIDRTLPSRMREDLSWRQTFMNILIEYYYHDIKEPVEVQVKTNEYRQENSDFYNWLEENIEYKEDGILRLSEVCELFAGKKVAPRVSNKYRKEIEKWIQTKFKKISSEFQNSTFNNEKFKGWIKLSIKSD